MIRTVHSVINRTPPILLYEIILVDDFSKSEELKEDLEIYCKYFFGKRVRILRANERVGLIKARLIGSDAANGEVLLFLDAHCEVRHHCNFIVF